MTEHKILMMKDRDQLVRDLNGLSRDGWALVGPAQLFETAEGLLFVVTMTRQLEE